MPSLCSTCLSQNRKLKPLKLIAQMETLHLLKLELHATKSKLCWECEADLTRADRFRRRAEQAQSILKIAQGKSTKQSRVQCTSLSTLSAVKLGPDTYYDDVAKQSHNHKDNVVKKDKIDIEVPGNQEKCTLVLESIQTEKDNDSESADDWLDISSDANSNGNSNSYNEDLIQPTQYSANCQETTIKRKPQKIFIDKKSTSVSKVQPKIHASHSTNVAKSNNATDNDSKLPSVKSDSSTTTSAKSIITAQSDKQIKQKTTNKNIKLSNNTVTKENTSYKIISISQEELYACIERARNELKIKTEKDETGRTFQFQFLEFVDIISQPDPLQVPPVNPFTCPLCSIDLENEAMFKKHCQDIHSKVYQCLKCPLRIPLKNTVELYKHLQGTHNTFLCRYCFMELDSNINLTEHVVEEHLMKRPERRLKGPTKCTECGKTFAQACTLKKHMETHWDTDKRLQQCPHCDKKLIDLNAHLVTAHSRKPESYCDVCNRQFICVGAYKRHLQNSREHNPNARARFECKHCPKMFYRKTNLRHHVRYVHEHKKLLVCETCGFAARSERNLRLHTKSKHDVDFKKPERIKDKICQYCGMQFELSSLLTRHVRTHTGEKPYHCAHCDWQFTQRDPLVTHLRGKHPELGVAPRRLRHR